MTLTFQPALDPFHAIFRLMRLRPLLQKCGSLPVAQVRIMDFYLLFPFRIAELRLYPKHQKFKKLAAAYVNQKPYGVQPDAQMLFNRMEPMQIAAAETLATRNFYTLSSLADQIEASKLDAPPEIAERVDTLNANQSDLMEFMALLATEYDIAGPDGLKARSTLMEHRYDAL
jgi:hypothetical protein